MESFLCFLLNNPLSLRNLNLNYMKKIFIPFTFILLFTIFAYTSSCNSSSDEVQEYPPKKINRLDEILYQTSQSGNFQALTNDGVISKGTEAICYMLNMGHPDDSALVKYVYSDAVKIFTPEVAKKFTNIESIEKVLGRVTINLEKEFPNIKIGNLFSFVSPYRQSIYICDSTILIALNHYLGTSHEAYNGFEEYIKKRKEDKFIPYDIVEALISSNYPYEPSGNDDLLSKMLYAGAIIEAKMRTVPNATLEDALGYSKEELKWVEENQQLIWNTLIAKELIYSTSYMDIDRLLSPAPNTSIINSNSPGQVGRYIGYKIVTAYLAKNSATTLCNLFSPNIYKSQQTLIKSEYNGK